MPENTPSKKFALMESGSVEALIPQAETPWLWIIVGAVILLAFMAWLIHQRRKNANDPTKIRRAAFNEAIAALDTVTQHDPHDAALESSMILRKFLSITAEDPVLFETHEEFISRHNALQKIPDSTRSEITKIFSQLAAMKYSPNDANASAETIISESRLLLQSLHAALVA
ncbi:MAG: hypothetical protein RIR37_421 [Verrucomicrobiota bacterium]